LSKKRRIVFTIVGVAALLVGGGGAAVYFAVHHVPRFYEEAVNIAPTQQKRGSDEMLRRSAALASDANRRGRWQAIFTAEQINGWLAVDLVQNHPKLLPPELHDPRVAIHQGQMIIGCRYNGQVSTVVSLEADVSLQETNVIAVRIRRARAGAIPLPLDKFMPEAIRSLQNAGFLVELRQSGADPVLLVTLRLQTDRGRDLLLKTLALRDGEVDVAGETK
jgi:hypothetical protein